MRWGYFGNRSVDLDHVGFELGDVTLAIAPGDPGRAVIVGKHGRVDVFPTVCAFRRHLVRDEGRTLGIDKRTGGTVGYRNADRLPRMGVIVFDRRVEPVAAVLADRLGCPGVLFRPLEIGDVHDRPVVGPMLHVLRGIDEPFAHIEHFVPLRFVMPDVEIERVAYYEWRRIRRELVPHDRVGPRPRIFRGEAARQSHGKQSHGHESHYHPTISHANFLAVSSSRTRLVAIP